LSGRGETHDCRGFGPPYTRLVTSSLHVIPRLPTVPEPPDFGSDPRQQVFLGVAQALSGRTGAAVSANLTQGFHAARVDLAALKAALESGISEFTKATLSARWEVDVRDWMHALLRSHVQRCKQRTLEQHENGVHVRIETQDDLGYYSYEFDVFPGR
jgi:hypothetical protein